jgi:starch-binding outer membrane protein, SusD/RagB family
MKKIMYVFAACCLITICGCDKKIDLANPNQPTIEADFWKTREHAYAGSTAMYNPLIVDGSYMRSFPGLTDSRGDDFTGDSPWLDLELTGKFIIPSTSGPVSWIWREFYLVINRANQVLDKVSKYDAAILPTTEKERILGQAYFLRGLAYYNLATTYKAVPVITTPIINSSEYYTPTATEAVLWNQIFSDFAAAEARLPITYVGVTGLDAGEKGRATKGAAAGMLGKSYLYRKDFANAAIQFEKFLNPGGSLVGVYSLMPNYRDNFRDANENNAESLFEIQFTEGSGTDMNWCCDPSASWKQVQTVSITYGQEGKGFSDYLPTRWIYNEYKIEKTVANKFDPRLLTTIASFEPTEGSIQSYGAPWSNPLTAIYPRKYTNDGVGNGKPNEFSPFAESGINYRVLRYADILLMYAEVLNELNRTNDAYPFIQQVRTRAQLPNLATTMPGMTQVQMRNQLAHERALEFAIEGQRINDLIRWGWFYDPAKLAILKSHDPDFNLYTPGNEYLPIPQQELDVNKNLLPNSAN